MNASTDMNRRTLLAATLAAGAVAAASTATAAGPVTPKMAGGNSMALRNVLLETGYDRDAGGVSGTRTELATVIVDKGMITAILPATAPVPAGMTARDAKGLLMLPAFRDMHIHLDKTYYGGPWVAPRKRSNGIQGQIVLERTLLPQLSPTLEYRAGKIVELLQTNGTTFARGQCNVDPVSGIDHISRLKATLVARNATFGHEIVAFPQHGFVSAHIEKLMADAMDAGATHVGGIDPTTLDGGMEKSLDTMLGIALDKDRKVDIHLHEPGASGIAAIRYMLDAADREPRLRNRITISHCFSLMSIGDSEVAELADRMVKNGVSIASTIPFGTKMMPIPTLMARGVPVYTGTDSLMDHWSVFGTGDVLEKAKLACQLYGWSDELGISQSLKIATGGPIPLSPTGERLWPKPGDPADIVLVAAACSAETVARQTPRKLVLHKGNIAAGAFPA
jgi:cytosine/adenosine deaminase-related metal-dependent hydrolase